MDALRDREERRVAVDHGPAGVDPRSTRVGQQRSEHLGDAAPARGRVHVPDPAPRELLAARPLGAMQRLAAGAGSTRSKLSSRSVPTSTSSSIIDPPVRPGRPPRGQSAAGTASTRRSRGPRGGRTRSSRGRPRARRRRRARCPRASRGPGETAVSTSAPTPSTSIDSNGERSRIRALEVGRHEAGLDVVAREAERGLREVVGAEREERGLAREPVGDEARPRQLDHRADDVVVALAQAVPLADPHDHLAQLGQLGLVVDERDHDLQVRRRRRRARGEHDRLDLHLVDLGMHDPQPAAAGAEHRVDLAEAQDQLELLLERRELRRALVAGLLDAHRKLDAVGQELVQRRVEQPDRDRLARASPRTALRSPAAGAGAARPARRAARAPCGP